MSKLKTNAAIQSAQLRLMLSMGNVSLISSVFLAAIIAYIQREVISVSALLVWCSLMVMATLLRAALVIGYQLFPADDNATHVRLLRFRLGILVAGVVWGSAGWLLFPADLLQYQVILIFTLVVLTAGGMVSFSADLVSATVFSVSVILPLIVRLFVMGDRLSVIMGMVTMLYLGFIIMGLRRINRNVCENITLRFDLAAREEKVKASEEHYRLLLSHAPVGIFHYDNNLVITYCNNRLADMLHNPIGRIIGVDMKHLKDQALLPALQKALAGDLGYYEGFYHATFSDANGWVCMTCTPFRDGGRNVEGGIGIVQDITERKQIEQDLYLTNTAVKKSKNSFFWISAEGQVTYANDHACQSLGYDHEELIGMFVWQFDPDFHSEAQAPFLANIRRDGMYIIESRHRRKDGTIYPVEVNANYIAFEGKEHIFCSVQDISARREAAHEINNLAYYDPLTRLPNRRLLHDRLNQALASSARSKQTGALLFIDLDNFKTLNDTFGHNVGDLLLQQVAERLTSCVREGDTVARLGGDEFVVMLEGLSEQELEAAAQTEVIGAIILATLNQYYQLATHEYHSTPSIGATLFKAHKLTTDELLKQADIAMYQAKKAGRNTLRFFDPEMQASMNARTSLERELRKALEKQQFHLYYQIQVDSSHRPLGAEVLIRWQHPKLGLVPPASFIPLAEETGMILPIGQWVLETACAQIKAWQQEALTRDLVLAVNVSAKQFHHADFVAQVHIAVKHHAIPPGRLKLELTESMLLKDIEDTIAIMNTLKKIGVQFSLDDFGTGYSSLQYLKRLPLDQIKIDQSFIRDLATDNNDKAIVRTIIAMAQGLNLNVIAEGVETEDQKQILLNKGCVHYQGYLFGKPIPIEQFMMLLREG